MGISEDTEAYLEFCCVSGVAISSKEAKRMKCLLSRLLVQVLLFFLCSKISESKETVEKRTPLTHKASIRSVSCPRRCYCSSTTWNCDGAGLKETPKELPSTLLYANFHNNSIKGIPSTFFVDLPLLRVIDFRNNSLSHIGINAFSDLPQLETIYLGGNKIEWIEPGAFNNLDALKVIRMNGNPIVSLRQGTFQALPKLEQITLNNNYHLDTIEPGSFRNLPSLQRIQMDNTLTNYTHLGSWDYMQARGKRTFAPGCPSLNEIILGKMKLLATSPGSFGTKMDESNFLTIVRRIGEYKTWSTDLTECDALHKYAISHKDYGVTLCLPKEAATLADSPSRTEKAHIDNPNSRDLQTNSDAATDEHSGQHRYRAGNYYQKSYIRQQNHHLNDLISKMSEQEIKEAESSLIYDQL